MIEPTSPTEIYVPYYEPAVVYGDWPYPDYAPYYFPPPAGYFAGGALATRHRVRSRASPFATPSGATATGAATTSTSVSTERQHQQFQSQRPDNFSNGSTTPITVTA